MTILVRYLDVPRTERVQSIHRKVLLVSSVAPHSDPEIKMLIRS